jgi:hypothetical protein
MLTTQEINHIISSLAAIIAITMAIIVMIRSARRERRVKEMASEAMRLASLAIFRVSSSRASRLEEEANSRSHLCDVTILELLGSHHECKSHLGKDAFERYLLRAFRIF